jgi:hypothetical protein
LEASGADYEGESHVARPDALARWRSPTAEFLPSFVALQDAVRTACGRQAEWEAKVAAGIRAALEFAAAEPAAVHALTIDARRRAEEAGDRAEEVVQYFAEMLGSVAPEEKRFPISTDEGAVESIAMVIRGQLLSGTTEALPKLAPELTYLALMPYTGLAEARRRTESLTSAVGSEVGGRTD